MRIQRLTTAAAVVAISAAAVAACSPVTSRSTPNTPSPPVAPPASGTPAQGGRSAVTVGPVIDVSGDSCAPYDAEVEDASWQQDVYAAWICQPGRGLRIGFARSADGGKTWGQPLIMPGSGHGWDPAVAVAPDGAVYVSFMVAAAGRMFPVVDVSRDEGATFKQRADIPPPPEGNWGDRDFITAGPHGLAYLTWDYAPTTKYLKTVCPRDASCSFTAGQLNAVMQKSADYGRTWGPITHISPGFPAGGADLAPLLIGPGGRVDVLYQALATDPVTFALGPGHVYFTSSADGGGSWSRPVRVGGSAGAVTGSVWWIDGAIAADSAGTLYATWDTQVRGQDIGWLSYSLNSGKTWSAPVRVTPDSTAAPHIVQSAGGAPGIDYVAWLSASSPRGYALYLRVFQAGRGWLGAPVQVSRQFGSKARWPGDTIGITTLPGGASGSSAAGGPARSLVLTWGSAVSARSQIYAATVRI